MNKPSKTHALKRTSPYGQEFIGTCFQCGTPNLTITAAFEPCPNQRGLSQDEALIEAVESAATIRNQKEP